jgi:hypothetical protein
MAARFKNKGVKVIILRRLKGNEKNEIVFEIFFTMNQNKELARQIRFISFGYQRLKLYEALVASHPSAK